MVVYGEMLILENIITGSVLLYITGEVFGTGFDTFFKKLRLAAGGILCGAFSLVIFCPVKMPLTVFMEAIFALFVCLIVFGKKGWYKKTVVFILATYFMGGITMGLLLVSGNTGIYTVSGVYTGDMKAAVLAMFTAAFFAVSKQMIRVVYRTKFYGEHSFDAVIAAGEKKIEAAAFMDTGNALKDPVTGKPAAVAGVKLWKRMEAEGMIMKERFCVIPYRTVGSAGLMEAVRVDYVMVGEKCIRNCIIARNDKEFCLNLSGNENCELLISKAMTQKGV